MNTPMNTKTRMLRRALTFAAMSISIVGLAGCGALTAQNPSGALRPVNAVEIAPDERVMLKGADLVAYFTSGSYQQGSPAFKSSYEGVSFYFASAENKAKFDQTPAQYLPQFGGYCANGLVYGIPWGGDADSFKMIEGKLYIFGGQGSKDAFLLDEKTNRALAKKYWDEEAKGSNSFLQRAKRLVLRVPHYKSGEELAQAVAAAKSAKP